MTNEELLQQAKDKVAKKAGVKNWDQLIVQANKIHNSATRFEYLDALNDRVTLLAIQSAREEAKKAIEDLGTIGHDPTNPMWETLPDRAEAVNAAYANAWNKFRRLAIEKLTAPGRNPGDTIMTVKELIEVLLKHDQTLPVYLSSRQDDTGDYDELLTPEHIGVADPDEINGYLTIYHSNPAKFIF